MNFSILKSRTVWTIGLLMAYNDIALVSPYLHSTWGMVATVALNILGFILATYFHVNPSQSYNPPQA